MASGELSAGRREQSAATARPPDHRIWESGGLAVFFRFEPQPENSARCVHVPGRFLYTPNWTFMAEGHKNMKKTEKTPEYSKKLRNSSANQWLRCLTLSRPSSRYRLEDPFFLTVIFMARQISLAMNPRSSSTSLLDFSAHFQAF